jgi:hypothetical protein
VVSSNICAWVNNKGILKENIKKSIEAGAGYTRAEITWYLQYSQGLPTQHEIEHELSTQIEIIPQELIYKSSIKNQWKAYAEEIKNCLLLIDLTNNTILLSYTKNSTTGRSSGFLSRKNKDSAIDKTDILYLLSHATPNTEITLLFLDIHQRQKETPNIEPTITISYKNLMVNPKEGEKLTYLLKSDSIYYSTAFLEKEGETPNTPAEMELIDTDNIKLRIHKQVKKTYYTTKKYKFNDYFYFSWMQTDIITLQKSANAKANRLEDEKEEFLICNNEKLIEITEYNKLQYNNLLNKQKIADTEQEKYKKLLSILENGTIQKLVSLEIGTLIRVKAIKKHNTTYKGNEINGYILIANTICTNNDMTNKKKDCLYYASKNIINYINKLLECKAIIIGKYNLITTDNNEDILKFSITGIFTNYNISYAETSRIAANPNLLKHAESQLINNINNNELKKYKLDDSINTTIKIKNCLTIDKDLKTGDEVFIIGIKPREVEAKKNKYIFYTEADPDKPYISNIHLEEFFKINKIPKFKFKMVIGPPKLTKTQNVALSCYIILHEEEEQHKEQITEQPTEQQTEEPKEEAKEEIKQSIIYDKQDFNIAEKDAFKLSIMPPNTILKIKEIQQKAKCIKTKYFFTCYGEEHINKIYISNYFLELLISALNNPQELEGKEIIIKEPKTTPTKYKDVNILLVCKDEPEKEKEPEKPKEIMRYFNIADVPEKDTIKLNDEEYFKQDDLINIIEIKKKNKGVKTKYIFKLKGEAHKNNIYCSNYFLEELISTLTSETELINKTLKITSYKTTKTKSKQRNIILIN